MTVVLKDAYDEGVGVGDLKRRAELVSGPVAASTYLVRGQEARPDHRLEANTGVGFILVAPMPNQTTLNVAGLGVQIYISCSSLQALVILTSSVFEPSNLRKDKLPSTRGDRICDACW